MAALWPHSNMQQHDLDGAPIVGAKAYFYDAGTLTLQTVYEDPDLSLPHDQPVLTDGYGRWPTVYLNPTPGEFRERATSPTGSEIYFDNDEVSVPLAGEVTPPDAGDTSVTLLFQTGDIKQRYGTGVLTGYVRGNGRSIGSASSGGTERANADCEDLFIHLWDSDDSLTVNGGRGATAADDWAANKRIALPDMRDRALIGLGGMGNTDADRIPDALVNNGESNTTLGATLGTATVALTIAEMPVHNHAATFTGTALSPHSHNMDTRDDANGGQGTRVSNTDTTGGQATIATQSTSAGTPAGTVAVGNKGSGDAHLNVQPSMFITIYLKL